ncbi:MAG: sulfatase [Planctomycetes bacterium]|nr:sulfatase [Planctomycetota bacterium]
MAAAAQAGGRCAAVLLPLLLACAAASAGEPPCVQRLLPRLDASAAATPAQLERLVRGALSSTWREEFDDADAWRTDWSPVEALAPAAPPATRGRLLAEVEWLELDGARGIVVPPTTGGVVRDLPLSAERTTVVRARVRLGEQPGVVTLQVQPLQEHRPGPAGRAKRLRQNAAQRQEVQEATFRRNGEWGEIELLVPPLPRRGGLRVIVQSVDAPFALDRVELFDAPAFAPLLCDTTPDGLVFGAGSGALAFTLDALRAEGLLLEAGAGTAVEVTIPARAPRFEALLAPLVAEGGGSALAPRLELRFDGALLGQIAFEDAAGAPDRFREWRLDLGPAAGRTGRLELLAAGSGALFLGAPLLLGAAAAPPPRFVLLSIDTLRADQLHCHGHPQLRAPALESLAAVGTRFAELHGASSWTLPTHASIMTGLPAAAHGSTVTERPVPSQARVLAEHLAEHGFATAAFTGGGMLDPVFGFTQGFDRYSRRDPALGPFAAADGAPQWPITPALEWLAAHADMPAFLFLHTYCVHNYAPEPEFAARLPELRGFDLATVPQLIARATAGDAATRPLLVALYDATLRQVDERLVAPLLQALERDQGFERTLLAVLSDHGDEWFDHDRAFHGEELWGELTRVPWLVRGPGVAAGVVVDLPAGHDDVAATLLPRLGLPRLEPTTGRDLLAAEPPAASAQLMHVSSRRRGELHALVAWPWKLVRRRPDGAEAVTHALFHLVDDPAEKLDRAAAEPARVAQLARLLDQRLAECRLLHSAIGVGSDADVTIDPELEAQLRALGYLGDEK